MLPGGNVLAVTNAGCLCWKLESLHEVRWQPDRGADTAISIWQSPIGAIPTYRPAKSKPRTAFNLIADGAPLARPGHGNLEVCRAGERKPITFDDRPAVQAVAFTPNGSNLIACCDRSVRHWDTNSWQEPLASTGTSDRPNAWPSVPMDSRPRHPAMPEDIIVWDIDL